MSVSERHPRVTLTLSYIITPIMTDSDDDIPCVFPEVVHQEAHLAHFAAPWLTTTRSLRSRSITLVSLSLSSVVFSVLGNPLFSSRT